MPNKFFDLILPYSLANYITDTHSREVYDKIFMIFMIELALTFIVFEVMKCHRRRAKLGAQAQVYDQLSISDLELFEVRTHVGRGRRKLADTALNILLYFSTFIYSGGKRVVLPCKGSELSSGARHWPKVKRLQAIRILVGDVWVLLVLQV